MKVFKFGGASVKDAEGVRNLEQVVRLFAHEPVTVVVSAMGKTTNALETIVQSYFSGTDEWKTVLEKLQSDHLESMHALFPQKDHHIYGEIQNIFTQLKLICEGRPEPDYNFNYDRVVSYGEIISTLIISAFLNDQGWENQWLDARKLIKTDANYRFARVNWTFTEALLKKNIDKNRNYVIQGFIGSDDNMDTTTLGREGSDYSASILAYALDAEEVTIWKDVPGVLNGDPKVFPDTRLLEHISFREAIELAYYGASVIHPKTIQPLQRKGIPLKVKSFLNPQNEGSTIGEGNHLSPDLPCYILKRDQGIIKLTTRDLAFIVEENLSTIYNIFHRFGARVNMMQNTAVSSSFCINADPIIIPPVIEELQKHFDVKYTPNVSLFTIRHYSPESQKAIREGKKIYMEQLMPRTWQIAVEAE